MSNIEQFRTSYGTSMYNANLFPLDALYGPWDSFDELWNEFAILPEDLELIPLGLTVAIREDVKIVEYWNPTKESGFIKKDSSGVDEIRVKGVVVGDYTSGDVIEKGTPMEDILKKIFTKELYPKGDKIYPTCEMSFNSTDEETDVEIPNMTDKNVDHFFEVGTKLNTDIVGFRLIDGVILTFEQYRDETDESISSEYNDDVNDIELKPHHVLAECGVDDVEYIGDDISNIEEREYELKGKISYTENKRIPQTNYDKVLTLSEYPEYNISGGEVFSSTITIKGSYKYWTLVGDKNTYIDKGENISTELVDKFNKHWFNSTDSFNKLELKEDEGLYFIIPSEYKLMYDTNSACNITAVEGGTYTYTLPNDETKEYSMWYMLNEGVYNNIRFVEK